MNMALPRYLAEEAIDLFAQKFLFVYKDHEISMEDILCGSSLGTGNKHGYYGVCTACRQAFEYHDVGNVGGKMRIKDVCPCCDADVSRVPKGCPVKLRCAVDQLDVVAR